MLSRKVRFRGEESLRASDPARKEVAVAATNDLAGVRHSPDTPLQVTVHRDAEIYGMPTRRYVLLGNLHSVDTKAQR